MRDNASSEDEVDCGLDWYGRLAREALKNLVSVRNQRRSEVKQDDLDHFMGLLCRPAADDPLSLIDAMAERRLDPEAVAGIFVPAAARCLGKQWEDDQITFVDVTVRTERLHGVVRHVDHMLDDNSAEKGPSFLIVVPEGEQHTLGAFVLATQLRMAGFSACVRIAPRTGELTQLLATARFDLAMVSVGCETGLASAPGLVKLLRLLSRDSMRVVVGGSSPLSDKELLLSTNADGVARDINTVIAEFGATSSVDGLILRARKA